MNELAYCAVTKRVLYELLAAPWSITRMEMEAHGGDPHALAMYLHETSDIQAAITTMGDAIPVCAFGGMKIAGRPDEATTWFIGGRLLPTVAFSATRMVRRTIRTFAKEIGVSKIVTISGSEHEDVDKWFRVLGYQRDQWGGAGRRYTMSL